MVTKAMLQEAAGIAENRRLQSIENMPQVEHQFSARFERKMNRLIRRVEHPIQHAFFRSVAAVLLVAFILFGTVFAISPKVRASVINWVKSTFFEYTEYSNSDVADELMPSSGKVAWEYQLCKTPEGYSRMDVMEIQDGRIYVYINKDNNYTFHFSYLKGERTESLFIKTDLHSHVESTVNGNSADIYITDSETETNAIIWRIKETDTLFCISGKFNQDTLVRLAESVENS